MGGEEGMGSRIREDRGGFGGEILRRRFAVLEVRCGWGKLRERVVPLRMLGWIPASARTTEVGGREFFMEGG